MHLAQSRTESSAKVNRSRIIIDYSSGMTIASIVRKYKTNRPLVERTVNKALAYGALAALDDLPRSGRPAKITDDAKLKDLKLFVDGQLIEDKKTTKPEVRINTSQANWMSIATQAKSYKTDIVSTMGMKNYTGLLDDFSIWTRALSDNEVLKLYSEGLKGKDVLMVETIINN